MDVQIVIAAIKDLIKHYIEKEIPHIIVLKYTGDWLPDTYKSADYLQINMKGTYLKDSYVSQEGTLYLSLPIKDTYYSTIIADTDIASVSATDHMSIFNSAQKFPEVEMLAGNLNRCVKLYNI